MNVRLGYRGRAYPHKEARSAIFCWKRMRPDRAGIPPAFCVEAGTWFLLVAAPLRRSTILPGRALLELRSLCYPYTSEKA